MDDLLLITGASTHNLLNYDVHAEEMGLLPRSASAAFAGRPDVP